MSDENIMFIVAEAISKGALGKDIVLHLEDNKFYCYEDGYWKVLENTPLDKMILDEFDGRIISPKTAQINVRKYSVAMRKQIPENLKPLVYRHLEDFNKTGFLNFPEGEMDVETGYIHLHNKENLSTLRMPYSFRFGAECNLWLKTLDEIFEKGKDEEKCAEKISMLQEFFGYCLTRETKQRKALLLIGPSNCGKSSIIWTARNMVGDENCSDVGVNFLGNPQHTADMMNKLINIDTDVSQDAKEYEEQFKKIAGGEPVRCSPKYIKPFTYKPFCKQLLASNGFPRVTDHSEAFYNRLIPIPCERIFEEEEQNKDLPTLLKAELPGIFNWAWEGLQRLNERGRFEIKDFMKDARQDLRDESNPIDVFFRENIVVTKSWENHINKQILYNKYLDWCKNNGNVPMSNIKFGKAVFQKYSKVTEKNSMIEGGIRVWRNLDLKDRYPEKSEEETKNINWEE